MLREVCSGTTEHVEVYDLEFDGKEETYEQLVSDYNYLIIDLSDPLYRKLMMYR